MNPKLWNIGLKIDELDSEIGFMKAIGAKLRYRETRTKPKGGKYNTALLEFGGTRAFLVDEPVFEHKLKHQLTPGLTHIVFEVDNLAEAYQRITSLGARVLIEPKQVSGGYGSRRIAFFQSPNGLVFEMIQILEAKV